MDSGTLLLNTLLSLLSWPLEACLERLREQDDPSPRLRELLDSLELNLENPRGFGSLRACRSCGKPPGGRAVRPGV